MRSLDQHGNLIQATPTYSRRCQSSLWYDRSVVVGERLGRKITRLSCFLLWRHKCMTPWPGSSMSPWRCRKSGLATKKSVSEIRVCLPDPGPYPRPRFVPKNLHLYPRTRGSNRKVLQRTVEVAGILRRRYAFFACPGWILQWSARRHPFYHFPCKPSQYHQSLPMVSGKSPCKREKQEAIFDYFERNKIRRFVYILILQRSCQIVHGPVF